jgi:hypothetical protein
MNLRCSPAAALKPLRSDRRGARHSRLQRTPRRPVALPGPVDYGQAAWVGAALAGTES